MRKGTLTISIDLELCWGVWHRLTPEHLRLAETAERPICAALLDLFERHGVRATWAIVAALLDEPSARSRPGDRSCWYAPDIVDRLVGSNVRHEIGTQGGRHLSFANLSQAEAREDLEFAGAVHRRHGFSFTSLVFPRNAVGHVDLVRRAGLRVFRGRDVGWFRSADRFGQSARRAANFVDKFLPIAPQPAAPAGGEGLVDLPGSMHLMGRDGPRRFISPRVTRGKLSKGLARACRSGATFHLWFHPANFYHRRGEQLEILDWFLGLAAEEAARGAIEVLTMGDHAARSGAGA